MFPEQGRSHAEEVKGVVGVTEESGERRAGQGISTRGRWQSHAWSEGAVAWLVVQVDADAMSVLGMLKQEPGTGEGLLAGSADVAGWLIFICGAERNKIVISNVQMYMQMYVHIKKTPIIFSNLNQHSFYNAFVFINYQHE